MTLYQERVVALYNFALYKVEIGSLEEGQILNARAKLIRTGV